MVKSYRKKLTILPVRKDEVCFCGVVIRADQKPKIMERKNPIEEARRYVANAEEVIGKASYDPELKSYTDSKYVKTLSLLMQC